MSRPLQPDLSARDRRTLAVGMSVVLALFLGFRGIPAWLGWVRGSRAAAAELVARAAHARATVEDARSPHGVDSLVILRRAMQPALIGGATPVQAGAALASLLADQAGLANVQLEGVELILDTAASGAALSRPRVRATMTADVRGLLDFVALVETSTEPVLAVRRLTVTASDPAAPPDRPEVLRASLEVEGIAERGVRP